MADSGILILGLLGLFLFGGKGSKKKAWTPLTGWNQGARYGGYRGAAFYDLGTQGGYNAWIKDAGRAYTGGLDLADGTIEGGGIPIPSDYDQVERRRLTPRAHRLESRSTRIERQRRVRSTEIRYQAGIKQAQADAARDSSGNIIIPASQDELEQRRLS